MAINLTYDPVLSRVRVAVTGIGASADSVHVERSTDQIRWTTVRGASALAISAGAANIDDYEFKPDILNYYRASAIDTGPITFVAAGTPASANNAPVAPTMPAGVQAGDLVLLLATIRNSGGGNPIPPANWTTVANMGNARMFGRIYDGVWTMPTVTFAGGVANADTTGQSAAWRNASIVPHNTANQLNASAQNIAYPALTITENSCVVLYLGWKQDDWTSVAAIAGAAEINEIISAAGDDAAAVWDYVIQTTAANIGAGSFAVTGGAAAISRGGVIAFPKASALNVETSSITPNTNGEVWLKSISRPFLNRKITLTGAEPEFVSEARNGVFAIIGRSYRVAVTDVRPGDEFELEAIVTGPGERSDLKLVFASGDPLYLQVPADHCVLESTYVVAGPVRRRRQAPKSDPEKQRHLFAMPFVEVAPPGPDVVGATVTYQNILSSFATYSALLAAEPTYADVLERIGDPVDVIVP